MMDHLPHFSVTTVDVLATPKVKTASKITAPDPFRVMAEQRAERILVAAQDERTVAYEAVLELRRLGAV